MHHKLTCKAPSQSHHLLRNYRGIRQNSKNQMSLSRPTKRWKTYWADIRKQQYNPSKGSKASLVLSVWNLSSAVESQHVVIHSATSASASASLGRKNALNAERTLGRRCFSSLWWLITQLRWLFKQGKKVETMRFSKLGRSVLRNIKIGSIATKSLRSKQARS